MLCKMCITVLPKYWIWEYVLLMFTDTVKELAGYPVQNCPSGSFLFWGEHVGRGGGIVNDIVWMGCPRRRPWTMLRTPVRICILLTSFTSVSLFFDWCYSSVYLSDQHTFTWGWHMVTFLEDDDCGDDRWWIMVVILIFCEQLFIKANANHIQRKNFSLSYVEVCKNFLFDFSSKATHCTTFV
jgi:hypothetical protein